MEIVVIINYKGGVGKTTVASSDRLNLADWLMTLAEDHC